MKSKQLTTEEDLTSRGGDQAQADMVAELENSLLSFNTAQTKLDICKQIKALEGLIEEQEQESNPVESSKESPLQAPKMQTIKLPLSG